MLFDTDVIIWALRGNKKACVWIDRESSLHLSAVSYVELIRGARDKRDQIAIQSFLRDVGFEQLPVTSSISHRAVIYIEEFALSAGLELADALIAATACEHGIELCSANDKHYRVIADLNLKRFRP